MFALDQRITVNLGELALPGIIVKVSFTKRGDVWYGVLLDSGEELHGIEAAHVSSDERKA